MKALIFLADVCLSFLVGTFLLRFLLQIVGANFRNPIAELVVKITNPIVMPLRKILPPIKKIDTATIIAGLLASLLMVCLMFLLTGNSLQSLLANPLLILWMAVRNILSLLLSLYWILIIFGILLSWFSPGVHTPFSVIIHQLTEPVLAPFRRIIPPLGGLDISPIPALLLISALRIQFAI